MMEFYNPFSAWNDVKELEVKPIAGGPVRLNPTRLKELYMIPWMATHSEAHPSLRFSRDPGCEWEEVEASFGQEEEGFVVGHDESGTRWQAMKDVRDLSSLLVDLPDGLEMELFTVTTFPEGRQRYVGTIQNGQWELERAYPELDADSLNKALEFGRTTPIEMPTEEMAERVLEAAGEDFDGTFMGLERDGKQLKGLMENEPDDSVTDMARAFAFAIAFEHGPWSFRPVDAEDDDEENEELAALTARLSQAMTQPDPEGQSLLFDGSFGRYFSGDILSIPSIIPKDLEILDKEMGELGFETLGDLTCNKIHNVVLRGYAAGDGCYAIGQASYSGMFVTEFYTAFEDGSSMTTSTNPHVTDIPKKKIYRSGHPSLEPDELFLEHSQAVTKHAQTTRGGIAGLEGLARAIDEYMERQGTLY